MLLDIITGNENKILRQKSEKVTIIDSETLGLIKNMKETMKKEKGIGIAAPQVGLNKRIILITIENKIITLINPEIISLSTETVLSEEGCLSLPGVFKNVKRAKYITIKYTDENNKNHELELANMPARITQHEIDHLEGILFVDRVQEEEVCFV